MEGFRVESPGTSDRIGCEAAVVRHPGSRTEAGCIEDPTATICFATTTSDGHGVRTWTVAGDRCAVERVASRQACGDIRGPRLRAR